jgi:hypothetical protein
VISGRKRGDVHHPLGKGECPGRHWIHRATQGPQRYKQSPIYSPLLETRLGSCLLAFLYVLHFRCRRRVGRPLARQGDRLDCA